MDPLHFVVLVVNIYLSLYLVSVRTETKINLPIAQRLALKKLRALVGNEQVHLVFAQGTDVLRAHLDAFMQFESTLIGQVQDHSASDMPNRYVQIPE